MTRVLFVCHGNICRSPCAEFVMKDLVKQANRQDEFEISSAATSTEELGNPVYPPMRNLLNAKGIDTKGKYARQMTIEDYAYYDLIILMDHYNLRNIKYIIGEDTDHKLRLLLSSIVQQRLSSFGETVQRLRLSLVGREMLILRDLLL